MKKKKNTSKCSIIFQFFLQNRWESKSGLLQDETTISHNVTNFEFLYEPFYVSTDLVPPHDERFLGYGFTRNTQVNYKTIDNI